MRTMHPSIMLGSYVWAQDRLPQDEFALRVDELRAAMDRNNWPAMLVYGDAREHAALAYVSNFIPRMRWGMAWLPRSGEARLLCAMGTRDLPAMRAMTWIADVKSGWGPEWEKAFDPLIAPLKGHGKIELGTIGFDLIASVLHDSVLRSLGDDLALKRADDIVPAGRKRPREVTMMRGACAVLNAAAKVFVESWRKEPDPEGAALAAEQKARSLAAQDVRTMVSLDGGRTLVPFQNRFGATAGPLLGYLAVKVMGYWADMFVTLQNDRTAAALKPVERALDVLIANVRPGVRTAELHAIATKALAPLTPHPVLGDCLGGSIGLSLNEKPEIRATDESTLAENGIYSLQVGAVDPQAGCALISAIVHATPNGADVLARSPSPWSGS